MSTIHCGLYFVDQLMLAPVIDRSCDFSVLLNCAQPMAVTFPSMFACVVDFIESKHGGKACAGLVVCASRVETAKYYLFRIVNAQLIGVIIVALPSYGHIIY